MPKPSFLALSPFLAATVGRNMTKLAHAVVAIGVAMMVLLTGGGRL